MQNDAFRPPELPSDLLAWLAALARDSSRVLTRETSASTLAALASEVPAYLDGVLLREAPGESYARHAWLEQLDQLDQARRGCASLDPGAFPWAPGLAAQLAEAIAQRAPAAQALRDELAAEEAFDEDEGEPVEETPLMQAWATVRELRRLSHRENLNDEQDLEDALRLARTLAEEPWVGAFREASQAFRAGQDDSEELGQWAAYGLEARLRLEILAGELLAPELFRELDRVDEALGPHGDALALIPQEDYDDLAPLGGVPRGWASWRETQERVLVPDLQNVLVRWGEQERAARQTPAPPPPGKLSPEGNALLATILRQIGAQPGLGVLEATARRPAPAAQPSGVLLAAAASNDALQLLDRLAEAPQANHIPLQDQLFQALQRMPCVWLRQDLKRRQQELASAPRQAALAQFLAMRLGLQPGNVPLLLAIPGASVGDVWQLRVSHRSEPGDPWERAGVLHSVAREAIRTAFHAAAAQMPHGLPPYPFEEHAIELIGGGHLGIQAIDGNSVGLSAALAFVSLWLDASIPEDLACTASVGPDGKLGSVGYVREKAEALARLAQRPVRLLLAQEASEGLPEHVQTLRGASLLDALEKAGLKEKIDEATTTYRPWLGNASDRRKLLQRYHDHVSQQNLGDYQARGMAPWLVLGDRIRLLVRSLETAEDAQTRQQVAQSRADAALAFTHGLDEPSARDMLRDLDLSRASPPVAVFAGIVALGSLLDRCATGDSPWSELDAPAEKLEADLARLPEADRYLLEGRVLGAIGRAWMHRRNLSLALEYLRRSVASHDAHLWQEAGRSRIYLATALRMAGQYEEAARTLEAAGPLLDRCFREESASYAEFTRLFRDYELARLLLELDRPLDAIAAIEARLPQARQVGSWPGAGMLRTLAWAAGAAGLPQKREEALRELEKVAGEDPFLLKLLREASGPFRRDGEVYLDPTGSSGVRSGGHPREQVQPAPGHLRPSGGSAALQPGQALPVLLVREDRRGQAPDGTEAGLRQRRHPARGVRSPPEDPVELRVNVGEMASLGADQAIPGQVEASKLQGAVGGSSRELLGPAAASTPALREVDPRGCGPQTVLPADPAGGLEVQRGEGVLDPGRGVAPPVGPGDPLRRERVQVRRVEHRREQAHFELLGRCRRRVRRVHQQLRAVGGHGGHRGDQDHVAEHQQQVQPGHLLPEAQLCGGHTVGGALENIAHDALREARRRKVLTALSPPPRAGYPKRGQGMSGAKRPRNSGSQADREVERWR
jgi:hypothetical protein